jgi:hypothetical protein
MAVQDALARHALHARTLEDLLRLQPVHVR